MELAVEQPFVKENQQNIDLVKGTFTVSEAADIVNSILEVKINFHKLQRLSKTEGNLQDNCTFDNSRIDELLEAQNKAREFFAQARLSGQKITMNSSISIHSEA